MFAYRRHLITEALLRRQACTSIACDLVVATYSRARSVSACERRIAKYSALITVCKETTSARQMTTLLTSVCGALHRAFPFVRYNAVKIERDQADVTDFANFTLSNYTDVNFC